MSVFLLLAAATFQSPVLAYHCGTSDQLVDGNVAAVNDAYVNHSLAIVAAALLNDTASLSGLVSPDAKFTAYEGDVGTGPRKSGPSAAVEFFKGLAPTKYQVRAAGAGPFSMPACGKVTSEVLLSRGEVGKAYELTFTYDRGILTAVEGSATSIIRGDFDRG